MLTTAEVDVDPTPQTPARRAARRLLLTVVFVCAACGLVYEFAQVTLGSIGNTATQAPTVLSVTVFAMGVGSFVVEPLQR